MKYRCESLATRTLIAAVPALLGTVNTGCERRVASAPLPPAPAVQVATVIHKDVPLEGDANAQSRAFELPSESRRECRTRR